MKKFWNKYIYGEEYVISVSTVEVTGRDIGLGTYWGRTDDITKPSAQYTGSWIKKSQQLMAMMEYLNHIA